jgi:hypothetical protein
MIFYVKQNDTSPAMLAKLQDGEENTINLAGTSVRFHMRKNGAKENVVDAPAVVISAPDGLVRYNWVGSDTAEVGSYLAEFEVTYTDSTVETFPNDKYIRVEIIDDIG